MNSLGLTVRWRLVELNHPKTNVWAKSTGDFGHLSVSRSHHLDSGSNGAASASPNDSASRSCTGPLASSSVISHAGPSRGVGLTLRRTALDLQCRTYPIATAAGAGVLFALGGFVGVLGAWLRDDLPLTLGSAVEVLGGAWPAIEAADADTSLGPLVTRLDAPLLLDEIADVARRAGSSMPRRVRMTHLPCCGVVACGRRERALVIGLPLLSVLSRGELRAVLAHELSHWARGDASRTERANQFIQRLQASVQRLEQRPSTLARFSPLHWWSRWNLDVAERMRAPIAHGQELRADAVAASIAGGDTTANALVKVALVQPIFREVLRHFEMHPEIGATLFGFFREFWDRLPVEALTSMRHDLFRHRAPDFDPAHPKLLDRLALTQSQAPRPFPEANQNGTRLLADLLEWEQRLHDQLFGAAPIERSVFHQAGR